MRLIHTVVFAFCLAACGSGPEETELDSADQAVHGAGILVPRIIENQGVEYACVPGGRCMGIPASGTVRIVQIVGGDYTASGGVGGSYEVPVGHYELEFELGAHPDLNHPVPLTQIIGVDVVDDETVEVTANFDTASLGASVELRDGPDVMELTLPIEVTREDGVRFTIRSSTRFPDVVYLVEANHTYTLVATLEGMRQERVRLLAPGMRQVAKFRFRR